MIREMQKIQPGEWEASAPPSKSYTHRALIAGALGNGETILEHPLYADDTCLTAGALEALGVIIDRQPDKIRISGCDGELSCREGTVLNFGNSGTSLRLLSSVALLCDSQVILTGDKRMQERPIGPLADAFPALGGKMEFLENAGYPPVRVSGRLRGGNVRIDGSSSSQFISSVLMAAPYAAGNIEVHIPSPPASQSYLDITIAVMEKFGAVVKRDEYQHFAVSCRDRYRGRRYRIEGDYSSASYFFALAAACGGRITVRNLAPGSVQGDARFLDALEMMGCTVRRTTGGIAIERTGVLRGIAIDMSTSPDTVQTLAVIAPLASTPTTITGIGHLKFKESDRINGTAERIRSLGGDAAVGTDSITIRPATLHGGAIDPENDHRTAMSFAILGCAIGGIRIEHAECVKKSFPDFWERLDGAIG
jgi:3-phosphoshikimate 1-carboxyvinyltransferase